MVFAPEPGLAGIRQGETYVLVEPLYPLGRITGTLTSGGASASGAVAWCDTLPFIGSADAVTGAYTLTALAGPVRVSALDPATGDRTTADTHIPTPGDTIPLDLALAPQAPAG